MRMLFDSLLAAGSILLAASTSFAPARAQNLTSDQLDQVKARLAEGATHSWEIGTRAQALIEADTPSWSVLNSSSLPPPHSAPDSLAEVVAIARSVVRNRTSSASDASNSGPQPLMDVNGGAAGDPPSIGVAVLLANWTGAGAQDDVDYAGAAQEQLQFLLTRVPRTSDGAISHRTEEVALWSDFVYMVPPFLAYYGVLTQNETLLQLAYDQCRLYRQYLVDDDAGGMWRHIVRGSTPDSGHWTTGNGWAAGGMLRVLGTIRHSQYSHSLRHQANDLRNWVIEIHNGVYAHQQTTGLFSNYADESATFDDASGTAILASTVYRLALLEGVHTHLPAAERSRSALSAPASSSAASSFSSSASSSGTPSSTSTAPAPASTSTTSSSSSTTGLAHFTPDGWLTPVVNPYSFGREGSRSPEGQAFVVEMYAAWRDWVEAGAPGANAAVGVRVGRDGGAGVGVLVAVVLGWVLVLG